MSTSINSAYSFKLFLQQKSCSTVTISRYQREVNKYLQWLDKKGIKNTTSKEVLDYLQYCKAKRQLSNATLNNILKALKNYYSYLSQIEGSTNITRFIKIRGLYERKLRTLLSIDELSTLCEAYYYHTLNYRPNNRELYFYPNYTELLQRRYIALSLIAYQGLQIQEVIRITPKNFNLHKTLVEIPACKKGATRSLPLEAVQIAPLLNFIKEPEDTPLLNNVNQIERLSLSLKQISQNTSISFLDFKQLRTSRISYWIKTKGLRKAQYMAGHRSINVTERFIHNDVESLQNEVKLYHPLT